MGIFFLSFFASTWLCRGQNFPSVAWPCGQSRQSFPRFEPVNHKGENFPVVVSFSHRLPMPAFFPFRKPPSGSFFAPVPHSWVSGMRLSAFPTSFSCIFLDSDIVVLHDTDRQHAGLATRLLSLVSYSDCFDCLARQPPVPAARHLGEIHHPAHTGLSVMP